MPIYMPNSIARLMSRTTKWYIFSLSKLVGTDFDIEHRFAPIHHASDRDKFYVHIVNSLKLLEENNNEVLALFKKNISTIFYMVDHKYAFEIFFNEGGILIINIPYYFPVEYEDTEYDAEWYEGITACLLSRVAFLTDMPFKYDKRGRLKINSVSKDKLKLVYEKEKSFATDMGKS